MKPTLLRSLCLSAAAVLAACGGGGGSEADGSRQAQAANAAPSPTFAKFGIERVPGAPALPKSAAASRIDRRLQGRSGEVSVWVQLDQSSLASTRAALARTTGIERVRGTDAPRR